MSPCEAVSIILDNDASVTALRGDRYYLGINMIPSGHDRPYQYCDQLDSQEFRHMTGRTGFASAQFELEHYADTPDDCINLAHVSRLALDQFNGVVTDDSDEFDITSIKLDDESHVAPMPISGQEQSLAVIRQSYQMIYYRNPITV